METMLAQHRADVAKALEHGVMRERARRQSEVAATLVEVEQARQELAEEQSRVASLLEEREELRLSASMYETDPATAGRRPGCEGGG